MSTDSRQVVHMLKSYHYLLALKLSEISSKMAAQCHTLKVNNHGHHCMVLELYEDIIIIITFKITATLVLFTGRYSQQLEVSNYLRPNVPGSPQSLLGQVLKAININKVVQQYMVHVCIRNTKSSGEVSLSLGPIPSL